MATLRINNARLVSPGIDQPAASILIEDGLISAIETDNSSRADEVVDAQGRIVAPGFIDIHTHGAGGASAMEGSAESLRRMAEMKLREGVTTFLPTTWTAPTEDLVAALKGVVAYQKNRTHAKTPCVHIEGPYINPDCVGAQNPDHVRLPDVEELDGLREIASIGLLSLATEMEGGVEFVKQLRDRDIVASLAHTAATYQQFLKAKEAGATHLTHYCNQMTKLHHREIGIVGAGLLDDDIMMEMICDTIHLCPEMIALTFKHKPVDKIMLITDSIAASWMEDGEYEEAGQPVRVVDGVCRLHNGALAGSTARYYQCLNNVRNITGRPLSELIRTTSWNQARSLGLTGLGKVEPGFTADLAILDPGKLEPVAIVIDGELRPLPTPDSL